MIDFPAIPFAVTDDGSMVVGRAGDFWNGFIGFLWMEETGMLDLNVPALGADWDVGNCHKWLCAPKGAGFLWIRGDRRDGIRPLVTSHGASGAWTDSKR